MRLTKRLGEIAESLQVWEKVRGKLGERLSAMLGMSLG